MRISDWSSDVCSSDLRNRCPASAIMLLCGFCSTGARERMMRKTRDYDAELRALSDKAKSIKAKKIQQLGELVTVTGARRIRPRERSPGVWSFSRWMPTLTDGGRGMCMICRGGGEDRGGVGE